MKSNFSRPFSFNNWISTKQYQKKVTETKVEKIPNGTLKMPFFAPWFLGFTTIIIKYSSFAKKKKKPVDFDGELKIGDVRYDNLI